MTDAEFRRAIIDSLLGEDWYVVDPLSPEQVNEVAFHQILQRYKKKSFFNRLFLIFKNQEKR